MPTGRAGEKSGGWIEDSPPPTCAGASTRPEFQLPALYTAAARSTFLSVSSDGSGHHHQRAPVGSRLITLLTGPFSGTGGSGTSGSSMSVRSLSQQEDGLLPLLEELVGMGSAAVQVRGQQA